MVAAIPLFIGLGYLTNAFVGLRLGPDTPELDDRIGESVRSPDAPGRDDPLGAAAEAPAATTSGASDGGLEATRESDREA